MVRLREQNIPRAMLRSMEVSSTQDILVWRIPPVCGRCWSVEILVAVVEED